MTEIEKNDLLETVGHYKEQLVLIKQATADAWRSADRRDGVVADEARKLAECGESTIGQLREIITLSETALGNPSMIYSEVFLKIEEIIKNIKFNEQMDRGAQKLAQHAKETKEKTKQILNRGIK